MELKIIDYETDKLAKEVGFDWKCNSVYTENRIRSPYEVVTPGNYNHEYYKDSYSAPTQELLRKWLRDEHNIHIQIRACYMVDDYSSKVYKEYYYKSDVIRSRWSISFKSYEQALEAALKEILKYLLNKND